MSHHRRYGEDSRSESGPGRTEKNLVRLAQNLAAIPQGLSALRRAREQRRSRNGVQRCRRDVANEIRHGARCLRSRDGEALATSEAAVRFPLHVHAAQTLSKVWQAGSSGERSNSSTFARKHVGTGLEQCLSAVETADW